MSNERITEKHQSRLAVVYVRQSTQRQVLECTESQRRQRDLSVRAGTLGWPKERIVTIDEDLGESGSRSGGRRRRLERWFSWGFRVRNAWYARWCGKGNSYPQNNLVFHGRAGHLAVPGLTHVFRIRTMIEIQTHVEEVMSRLSLDRSKAREYVERVDEDISRWVRTMYNISGDPWAGYDLAVNLDRVDVGGATTALCGFAQLPEFSATPASSKVAVPATSPSHSPSMTVCAVIQGCEPTSRRHPSS